MTPFPHPAHRTGLPNGEGDGVPDNSISCRCSPDEVIVWAFPNIPVNEWPELKIAIITFAIDRGAEWRVWVKNGCGGNSTGTSAVPQIADDIGAPRKPAELGHKGSFTAIEARLGIL
jgi:hypothetical protein